MRSSDQLHLTSSVAQVILVGQEPSKEVLIAVSPLQVEPLGVVQLKINVPPAETLGLKVAVVQWSRSWCWRGGRLRILQTAVVSEYYVIQSDVSAILGPNRGRELEEVREESTNIFGSISHNYSC